MQMLTAQEEQRHPTARLRRQEEPLGLSKRSPVQPKDLPAGTFRKNSCEGITQGHLPWAHQLNSKV